MAVKDFTLSEELDVIIENGDFKVSDSDTQHIELVLRTFTGAWKQFPLVGMGIDRDLASSGKQQVIKRNMQNQLELDGYNVKEIKLLGNAQYFINAIRIRGIDV